MVAPIKPEKAGPGSILKPPVIVNPIKSASFIKDQMDEKPPEVTAKFGLQDVVANLELLYVKAKNFHWNVEGSSFYSLHHTFDGVQEVALDWADTIAERARALEIKIDARMSTFLKQAWFPEAQEGMSSWSMIDDMVLTLTCICAHLCKAIEKHTFDPVTENMLQDLAAQIDKQLYFVRSNKVTQAFTI